MLKYSFKILKIPNNSLLFFFKTHGDFSSWSRQSHTCSQTLLPRGWHLTFNVQITATAGLKGCVPFFFFFQVRGQISGTVSCLYQNLLSVKIFWNIRNSGFLDDYHLIVILQLNWKWCIISFWIDRLVIILNLKGHAVCSLFERMDS